MLGPKEPNLYKDLSQDTVTKGIQIKIFSQKQILKKKFFFFLKIWIQMHNLDLDSAESGSGLHIWIQIQIFEKKFFFLIFTFPYVTIMKI